ncbi:hypothetical protein C8A03DRAFT_38736 [Achaetomium macrosporum]|uniref:Serine protease n=1 Tax=Achaetomium macrosporum TaxID=79813 RepID=A0AAN7C1L5_9PEZI|nr:hypothetical protein C8A03DRAFT_38736 [Achaetomium macrosporum]
MAPTKEFPVCRWELKGQKNAPEQTSEMALTPVSETVFDPDNRRRVAAEDYGQGGKYRAVLKLHMRYKGQKSDDKRWAAGSGWLIAPDLLVTAGHCVYDHVNQLGPATHIKAYVGYHGKKSVQESSVQTRYGKVVITASAWINAKVRINDFALVQLETAFDRISPIKYSSTPAKGSMLLGVVGYPADRLDQNGERGAHMYADFEQVSFDRNVNDGLLAYAISTYAGQSGSPVLRSDDKGSVSGSIATHVAGSGTTNFASPIAADTDNPYRAIVNHFYGSSAPTAVSSHNGISYYNVPLASGESYGDPFTGAWKASLAINGPVPSNILTDGPVFRGPVGSASSILAGTMVGYMGRMSQSAIDNEGRLPKQLPEDTGVCERALIAETALQFLLTGQRLPNDTMKKVLKKTKDLYNKTYPFLHRAAPHLTKDVKESAMRVALDHIRRSEDKTLPSDTPSTEKKQLNPTDESARGDSDVDSKTADFRKRLLNPTYELDGEEGFFDVLGDVINVGMNVLAPPIVKLAPVALNLLSNVLKQESDMDEDDPYKTAQDQELTDLACRALLAEAALEAFIDEADHKTLEEKGFFDFVKTAMQKVGGAVLANAPRMIDAAVPIVKSLLQPDEPGQTGQEKDQDISADDVLGDLDQSKEAPSKPSSEELDVSKYIKDGHTGPRGAPDCWPRRRPSGVSHFVRTRYLASVPRLQASTEKKTAKIPEKADENGDISAQGVIFGDAGQDGIYWEE